MDVVQGLNVTGRFRGVGQKKYGKNHAQAGEPIPGMYEVLVGEERRNGQDEFVHRIGFFWEDYDGGVTPFAEALENFDGQDGELVAVRVRPTTKERSAYVNLDPVKITRISIDEGSTLTAVS